jgi:hypothetical protein
MVSYASKEVSAIGRIAMLTVVALGAKMTVPVVLLKVVAPL